MAGIAPEYLTISEINRSYNKHTIGYDYPLSELFVKKLLETFKENIIKITKGVTINKTALTEFINANREEIYKKLKIRPAALINFIENPNMQVSSRTRKSYLEKIELIKAEYGLNMDYDFNQF